MLRVFYGALKSKHIRDAWWSYIDPMAETWNGISPSPPTFRRHDPCCVLHISMVTHLWFRPLTRCMNYKARRFYTRSTNLDQLQDSHFRLSVSSWPIFRRGRAVASVSSQVHKKSSWKQISTFRRVINCEGILSGTQVASNTIRKLISWKVVGAAMVGWLWSAA